MSKILGKISQFAEATEPFIIPYTLFVEKKPRHPNAGLSVPICLTYFLISKNSFYSGGNMIYEKPRLVILSGEKAWANCQDGSAELAPGQNCQAGGTADNDCQSGSTAGNHCQVGNFPSN